MLKSTTKKLRAMALVISSGIIGVAGHLWNDPRTDERITSWYTIMILMLFFFLVAMMMQDASEKRKNFNAILILVVAVLSFAFVVT